MWSLSEFGQKNSEGREGATPSPSVIYLPPSSVTGCHPGTDLHSLSPPYGKHLRIYATLRGSNPLIRGEGQLSKYRFAPSHVIQKTLLSTPFSDTSSMSPLTNSSEYCLGTGDPRKQITVELLSSTRVRYHQNRSSLGGVITDRRLNQTQVVLGAFWCTNPSAPLYFQHVNLLTVLRLI